MAEHGGKLEIDDDYQITWFTHKSKRLEHTRGYPLEFIGKLVVSGSVPTYISYSERYPFQTRYTLMVRGDFFTIAIDDSCKVVPVYEHLATYFFSDPSDIDEYYKQTGV